MFFKLIFFITIVSALPPIKDELSIIKEGISYTGAYPPDCTIGVSKDRILIATNGENKAVKLYDKSTMNILDEKGLTIFQNGNNVFDPRIIYDKEIERFIVVSADGFKQSSSNIRITVSKNNIPNNLGNEWIQKNLMMNSFGLAGWCDYPTLGSDKNNIYINCNIFSDANSSIEGRMFKIKKSAILSTNTNIFSNTITFQTDFTTQGMIEISDINEISNNKMYLTTKTAQGIRIYEIDEINQNININKYIINVPYNNEPINAQQKGGAHLIETNDSRMMNMIKKGKYIYMVYNTRINAVTKIAWYKININTKQIEKSGYINNSDAKYYYYPCILVTKNDDIVIMSLRSDSSEYVSIYKHIMNKEGEIIQNGVIKQGESYYTRTRYGDYNGCQIDPEDERRIWYHGETPKTRNDWQTYIYSECIGCDPSDICRENCKNGECKVNIITGTTECICNDGYTGEYCDIESECIKKCKNGQCIKNLNEEYECKCNDGYYSEFCEYNNCENNCKGQCVIRNSQIYCVCELGFVGDNCEKCEIGYYSEECLPCNCPQNQICNEGLQGTGRCKSPDLCITNEQCNLIQNECAGGLCIEDENENRKKCKCYSEYYGEYCENKCKNCGMHGKCDSGSKGTGKCICDQGYTGETCEKTTCDENICKNGQCIITNLPECRKSGNRCNNDEECRKYSSVWSECNEELGVCSVKYWKELCEIENGGCCELTGYNNSTDLEIKNDCICNEGFITINNNKNEKCNECDRGRYSEECIICDCDLSECDQGIEGKGCPEKICKKDEECFNEGICINNECECKKEYYGDNCEFRCIKCENGVCKNGICICNEGYKGAGCDECEEGRYSEECKECPECPELKICDEGITGTGNCTCIEGYNGENCQYKECTTNGECNFEPEGQGTGGVCVNINNDKRCLCYFGYYSKECKKCPECLYGQCDSGSQGTGRCICNPGYTGELCDKCENERYSQLCLECQCEQNTKCDSGIEGTGRCIDISECQTNEECNFEPEGEKTGGICIEEINENDGRMTNKCRCYPEYYSNKCIKCKKCENGGECDYGSEGTGICKCKRGYIGERCEIPIPLNPN